MTPAIIDRQDEIRTAAQRLYTAKADWITFYREILGLRGMIRRHFPTLDEMAGFEHTETYREIQRMLADLRRCVPAKKEPAGDELAQALGEETKVITVRIPQSLHDALKIEAYEHHTSVNKLCISKLLQFVDADHVPSTLEPKEEKPEPKEEEKAEAGL